MIEDLADFLFALKAGKKGRIALELQEGNLDGHGSAGLEVIGPKNGGHAAATNHLGDVEALIQDLADLNLGTHARLGCFLVKGQAPVVHPLFHTIDANHKDREIIVGPSLLGEFDQPLAGLGRFEPSEVLGDLDVGEVRVQAIGTHHEEIAAVDHGRRIIDLDGGLLTHAAGEEVAELTVQGLFLGNQAQFDLHADVGMIGGEATDTAILDEKDPAIADVADGHLIVAEDDRGQGGSHAAFGAIRHAGIVDSQVAGGEHLPKDLVGRSPRLHLDELAQGDLDDEAAGHLALALSAHAVCQQGHRAAETLVVGILGTPEAQVILVVGPNGPGQGQLGISHLHSHPPAYPKPPLFLSVRTHRRVCRDSSAAARCQRAACWISPRNGTLETFRHTFPDRL